jgi:predicted Ser/Thr protein kinase
MPLSPGTRLGPYEIRALIGKGGMGEVYRAHDPRLGRDVSIKVSAERFSERFEREARLIASLNHPNICTLYDVAPDYLVMEYIEGESPKGPMPLEGALKIARQIADALEAAHEKPIPITHRDLKPANIKVKPDGLVKVLDFRLAKAHKPPPEDGATVTMGLTEAGTILGTPAYMSPEQAVGKKVDKRSDIWAFGVVLYEMLTGERPFKGAEKGDILESVVKEQPDFSKTPPAVHRLLRKCLEKDPRQRLRDIGDVWELMEDAPEVDPAAEAAPLRSRFGSASWIAWAVAAVLAIALAFVYFREAPPVEHVLRYTIAAPENSTVHSFAVSPDGHYVAIAAAVNGKRQIWLRALDALQPQPMPGTDGATYPFWSPDSRYIGFFAQEKLKKIAAGGGPAQSLCDAPDGRGGSWSRENIIVFSSEAGNALERISAAGGVLAEVNDGVQGRKTLPGISS